MCYEIKIIDRMFIRVKSLIKIIYDHTLSINHFFLFNLHYIQAMGLNRTHILRSTAPFLNSQHLKYLFLTITLLTNWWLFSSPNVYIVWLDESFFWKVCCWGRSVDKKVDCNGLGFFLKGWDRQADDGPCMMTIQYSSCFFWVIWVWKKIFLS